MSKYTIEQLAHELSFLKKRLFNIYTLNTGIAVCLINNTSSNSVYGEIVEASVNVDEAFEVAGANDNQPIGIIAEAGIPDGELCFLIASGSAEVLLKNGTAGTRGNWVKTSDTAGRADATNAAPPGGGIPELDEHMQELGHCLKSVSAGTNVLCSITIHFN